MDQGLLAGIAEGLRSGLTSYSENADRKYRRDLEQKKYEQDKIEAAERLGLLKEQREDAKRQLGLKRDEEGNWVQDPESLVLKKEAREAESAKQQGLISAANLEKTKAETAKTYAEINKAKKEMTGGSGLITGRTPTQKLTGGSAENLAGSEYALSALKDAAQIVKDNEAMFGKMSGFFGTGAKYLGAGDLGTSAASIDADLKSKAQTIGRYLEGGKLAEADIERYMEMLPSRYDNPDIVANKVATLQRLVEQKYNADLKNYQNAGFDTGNLKSLEVSKGLLKDGNSQTKEDPQVAAYAKQYGLDYAKAKAIIDKRRGM